MFNNINSTKLIKFTPITTKLKENIKYLYLINFFIVFISLVFIIIDIYLGYRFFMIRIYSILIIVLSLILCYRVRRNKLLFILFCIISYFNISISILDGLYNGAMYPLYQQNLRSSEYNNIYIICILLTLSTISFFLTPLFIEKSILAQENLVNFARKQNLTICIFGIFGIIFSLIFGYERVNSIEYISNAKPIYEYAMFLFLIVWYYSFNKRIINIILFILAIIYILQGLIYGDRSSSLVFIVGIITVFVKDFKLNKLFILSSLGIFLGNLVSVIRDNTNLEIFDIIKIFLSKGFLNLFSDTASYSYYTGLTIIASRFKLPEQPSYYLKKFIIAIFMGSESEYSFGADITTVVQQITHNSGGGLYPSYFYFWGNYFGIILGAIILAFIVRFVFTNKSNFLILARYVLIVMSFRWYLYTPFTLFRSSIFLFSILYFIVSVIFSITTNRINISDVN